MIVLCKRNCLIVSGCAQTRNGNVHSRLSAIAIVHVHHPLFSKARDPADVHVSPLPPPPHLFYLLSEAFTFPCLLYFNLAVDMLKPITGLYLAQKNLRGNGRKTGLTGH